ncbi:MAG: hypothetical protein PHQ42_04755 [Patescibacteria group bacterium]|nr:hypothetical protein [Patescibacteria group bacterium]
MKLIINKSELDTAPEQWLRRVGYAYIRDRRSGQESFVRRLGSNFYPRFHMYFIEENGKVIFNLHLDQKQASYAGAHKHNAEYGGEQVESEIARLKGMLGDSQNIFAKAAGNTDPLDRMGQGEYDNKAEPELKKSLLRRIFHF